MNRFLKYFMMLLTLVLIVVPVILSSICIKLLKVQCKPHTINLIRSVNQNIREGKVNPSKDAVSILFLGIDDNEGRRKMAKLQNIQERIL